MEQPTAEKGYSRLEWFFYIIVLPVLFISILTIVLLWFLDYDLKGKVLMTLNEIPYVEKLIDDQQFNNYDNLTINNSKEQLEATIAELKNTLTNSQLALTQVENQTANKDQQIAELQEQIDDLLAQLSVKNTSEKTREEEIAELAKVYANMNPKNAAGIIASLDATEALLILSQMSVDTKSAILEKMDLQTAAELSILLKDQKYSKDQDIQALQARISQLVEDLDEIKRSQTNSVDYQLLAATYSEMEARKAAESLLEIYNTDKTKAQNILAAMSSAARAELLNQMSSIDSAKLTIGLLN